MAESRGINRLSRYNRVASIRAKVGFAEIEWSTIWPIDAINVGYRGDQCAAGQMSAHAGDVHTARSSPRSLQK